MCDAAFAAFNVTVMSLAMAVVMISFMERGGRPTVVVALEVAGFIGLVVQMVTGSVAADLRSLLRNMGAAVPAFALIYVGAASQGSSWRPSLLVWALAVGGSISIRERFRTSEQMSRWWFAWSMVVALTLLGTTLELIFGDGGPPGQLADVALPRFAGAILGLSSLPALAATFAPAIAAARRELRRPPEVDLDRRDWWCVLAGLLLLLVVGQVAGAAVGAPLAGCAAGLVLGIVLTVAWDLAAGRGYVRWGAGPLGPAIILLAVTLGAIQFHRGLSGEMPALSFQTAVGWEAAAVWLIGRWLRGVRPARSPQSGCGFGGSAVPSASVLVTRGPRATSEDRR